MAKLSGNILGKVECSIASSSWWISSFFRAITGALMMHVLQNSARSKGATLSAWLSKVSMESEELSRDASGEGRSQSGQGTLSSARHQDSGQAARHTHNLSPRLEEGSHGWIRQRAAAEDDGVHEQQQQERGGGGGGRGRTKRRQRRRRRSADEDDEPPSRAAEIVASDYGESRWTSSGGSCRRRSRRQQSHGRAIFVWASNGRRLDGNKHDITQVAMDNADVMAWMLGHTWIDCVRRPPLRLSASLSLSRAHSTHARAARAWHTPFERVAASGLVCRQSWKL